MRDIDPPLKWHGGKAYLASRIVALMPDRCHKPNCPAEDDPGWLHYVEPYFGGGSVMLALDPDGISEVANDLNVELTTFWTTLQVQHYFEVFQRLIEATPFSEVEWNDSTLASSSIPLQAARFFVKCRQSLAGRMDAFAPLSKSRTRRGMNEQASAWLNAVEGLPAVHARLKRVAILNQPAIDVIRKQDGPRTLFYLDPPYLHETRATTGEYEHEMTAEQHEQLLALIQGLVGRFMLSGYRSTLYDSYASANNWRRVDIEIPNNAAGGKEKRRMTECVWMNY